MKRLSFSPIMANAVRDGIKDTTRRVGPCRFAVDDRVVLTSHWCVGATFDDLKPINLSTSVWVWHHFKTQPKGNLPWGKMRQARFVPLQLESAFPSARIVSVHSERLGDIRDEEAVREGFYDRDEFIAGWLKINGEWAPDIVVSVIRFEVRP